MDKRQVLITVFLVLAVCLRVLESGTTYYQGDPELERIASEFEEFRFNLSQRVEALLPQPQAGLLSGMVLGLKSSLPSDFKNALRKTSTIHIVVVSGQNLTLVGGLILNLSYLFGRRKTTVLSIFAILFYAVLTGLQVPVIRAGIMVLSSSAAKLLGREGDSGAALIFVSAGMLLYNPAWLFSISFQLSVLATVGVVFLAPAVTQKIQKVPGIIRENLAVSLSAQLLTLPVIAANFHQMSLIGVIVNTLVLWLISFVMVTGSLAIALSFISISIGWVFALIPGVMLTYFVYIVQFFSSFPVASVYVPAANWMVWVGYYVLLLGIYLHLRKTSAAAL